MDCKTGRYPYPTCFLTGPCWKLTRWASKRVMALVGNGHVSNLGQKPEIGHHFPQKIRVSGINLWVDALQFGIFLPRITAIKLVTFSSKHYSDGQQLSLSHLGETHQPGWVGDAPIYFLIGQSTVESNFVAAIDSPLKQLLAGWWFGIFFIFHFIYGMSSLSLTFTPSFFQRGRLKPPTSWFIRGHGRKRPCL